MSNNNTTSDILLSLVRSKSTLTDWQLQVETRNKRYLLSYYLKYRYPTNNLYEQRVPFESIFRADARPGIIPALQCTHPYPHCESSCSNFNPTVDDFEDYEALEANANAGYEFDFELEMKSFNPYEGLKDETLDNPEWPLPPTNPDFNSLYAYLPDSEIVEQNEFVTGQGAQVDSNEIHERVSSTKPGVLAARSDAVAESATRDDDKNNDEEDEEDDISKNAYSMGLFSKTPVIINRESDGKSVVNDSESSIPAPPKRIEKSSVVSKLPNPTFGKEKEEEQITTVEDVLNMYSEPIPWGKGFDSDDEDDANADYDYTTEPGFGTWDPYEFEFGWGFGPGSSRPSVEGGTLASDSVYEPESEGSYTQEVGVAEDKNGRLFSQAYYYGVEAKDEHAPKTVTTRENQKMKGLLWLFPDERADSTNVNARLRDEDDGEERNNLTWLFSGRHARDINATAETSDSESESVVSDESATTDESFSSSSEMWLFIG